MTLAAGRWAALALVLLACSPALAQGPAAAPPGPYVIDLRGATTALPQAQSFYPAFPSGTIVPKRGFGFDVGAHVYPLRLGAARIGIGADLTQVRGTARTAVVSSTSTTSGSTTTSTTSSPSTTGTTGAATVTSFPDVTTTARIVAPQVSLNFGDHDGWSYVSVGFDAATITSRGNGETPLRRDSGRMTGPNVGGGARWFVADHFAFGFDLRFHALPGARMFAASVGLSVR